MTRIMELHLELDEAIAFLQMPGACPRKYVSVLKEVKKELTENDALFAMQRRRSREADELWQKATGNHDTLPDLGGLLEWLMNEAGVKE